MLPEHLIVEKTVQPATVRERELEVGRLMARAAISGNGFLVRRAVQAVDGLDAGPARRALRRAADGLVAGDDCALGTGLLGYGAVLERHGLHDVAAAVYDTVMVVRPGEACVTLHAARAARKCGRREEALSLYRRAGAESAGDGHMQLLVQVGEALVSTDPGRALTLVARAARAAGDVEVLAIAHEERARVRATAGRSGAALRDLAAAAVRYGDRTDRIRVLHRMAELLAARGDLLGAREVLHAALDVADAAQRGHTVQRLRTVARALGDDLELRRTRGQAAGAFVTLTPVRSRASSRTLAPRLRGWRSLLSSGHALGSSEGPAT